jgi:3-oxoacyl-[acyl-carrier-protein] synthase II
VNIVIKDCGVVTPFGIGIDPLWNALIAGKSAIAPCRRFDVSAFDCKNASILELEIGKSHDAPSLIWSLLEPLRDQIKSWECDHLILATTKGEIDLLERELELNGYDKGKKHPEELTLNAFRKKVVEYLAIPEGTLVSAACASSNSAIGIAAEMLLAGRAGRVCVIGIDIVSKFVFSGFSALQALSSANLAKPFDLNRDGLIPGEGCGAILLECESRRNSDSNLLGKVIGWGTASDANHVTGPSRDGSGLAAAIAKALDVADISPGDIGAISAHGTATVYNDAMEMHAFKTVFPETIPAFSVKGALGHTMGASGIIETIISLYALKNKIIPPTAGFTDPDEFSEGWVSAESAKFTKNIILKTNSGFGGINAALLIQA